MFINAVSLHLDRPILLFVLIAKGSLGPGRWLPRTREVKACHLRVSQACRVVVTTTCVLGRKRLDVAIIKVIASKWGHE